MAKLLKEGRDVEGFPIKKRDKEEGWKERKGRKSLRSPGRKLNQDTRDSKEPVILGMCGKARLGLRQFKEACLET